MNRNNLISLSLMIAFFIVIFPKNLWANSSIVTGHVYANPNEFEYILEQTKTNDVDTIFILGDIENVILNKIKYYENLYNINIHTVPGNHEITDNKDTNNYIEKYGSYRTITEQNQLNILLNTIEIQNRGDGAPIVVLKEKLMPKANIQISISHTDEYATAIAILEI